MENKKAEGKGWSNNKELCPSFRGESLKSRQTLLLWLELYSNILSHPESLPLRQTQHSYHATVWLLLSHKYWASAADTALQFTVSQQHVVQQTPVCFSPARDIADL